MTTTPHRVIPEIFVHDGPGALEFYKRAFGAVELARMMTADARKVINAELEILGHPLFLCDEFEASQGGTCRCPRSLGGTGVRIILQVEDADAVVAKAAAAGATVMMPVADMFWGARYGKLLDPYGHEWGINQQVKTVTPAEEAAAAEEYFANRHAPPSPEGT
jgi:PhnB protein